MNGAKIKARKRLNITLPEDTLRLLSRVAPQGMRSSFITHAVHFYVGHIASERLRDRVKEGAMQRADRDLRLATEWFDVDEEVWESERARVMHNSTVVRNMQKITYELS